jgi:SAM-dependent methyltransferase
MPEPSYLHAVRASYDTVAVDYAALLEGELAAKALDRAMLAAFAERVRAHGPGPVADLGCGPGRVTAHLHGLGLDAFGVDLSPGMVAEARRRHPELRFEVGSMLALDIPDRGLAGALAWYSIIHTPRELLPDLFDELHRVLTPGGHLLLAFQVGTDSVHREHAYGHPVSLDGHRLSPDRVEVLLTEAGFVVHARLVREPEDDYERTPQGFVMARRR